MAVYTLITPTQLAESLLQFELELEGPPRGVSAGIENSTYFFEARDTAGRLQPLVLSIVENCPSDQLDFACALMVCLRNEALPVPAPLVGRRHQLSFEIAGKPAFIVPRASGAHALRPSPHECALLGEYMARAHLAGAAMCARISNRRGLAWLERSRAEVAPLLSSDDIALCDEQIRRYRRLLDTDLPRGAIHADLFRDNALFENGTLAAVIDFLFACTDWWLLDLAIALNDWCSTREAPGFDAQLSTAMLNAYGRVRPFTLAEHDAWQDMLCIAAARFWVSRLLATLNADRARKDPAEYRALLLHRRTIAPPLMTDRPRH